MKRLFGVVSFDLAVLVLMIAISSSSARAQENCLPVSGTLYGYLTDEGWSMVGNFTIGREVYQATALAVNTSFIGDPTLDDVWQGTETWAMDFGEGNTIQVMAEFVSEHSNIITNKSGIFHVIDGGPFANGTGAFKHAYGNLLAQGPFGPGVKLPPTIQSPEGTWYFVGSTRGTVCGMNNR